MSSLQYTAVAAASRQGPYLATSSFARALAFAPRVTLIVAPTPAHRLTRFGAALGAKDLWVKREDQTAPVYGGNKVRNLEFLLGDALHRGATTIVTPAPIGSNFVAALAAHAARFDLDVVAHSFHAASTDQIARHAAFAAARGAKLRTYLDALPREFGAAFAYAASSAPSLHSYWIPPGGSSAVGALGHVAAALELGEQVRAGTLPAPAWIVVGAGTLGTTAGLAVGLALAGLPTRVAAVRCVDRLVCNKPRLARLANRIHALLGISRRFRASDFTLLDAGGGRYAAAAPRATALADLMMSTEGIALDTTYTANVVCALERFLAATPRQPVLYWHTYTGAIP